MEDEGLTPGVEHGQRADVDMQAGSGDIGQGTSRRAKEQVIEEPWPAASDDVQRFGNGEHDMEVRHWQQLTASCFHPFGTSRSLTAWTAATPTGVPLHVLVSATITSLAFSSESWRAARSDGPKSLALAGGRGVREDELLVSGSDDGAEIMLGVHVSRRARVETE